MSMLEKFTVVDLIKTRSASVATVTGNILKFNVQTAAEMHFAPYVQILVNPKDKQFAIRACKECPPERRCIHVAIRQLKKSILIKLENDVSEAEDFGRNQRLVKNIRGYGMESIELVTRKYQGSVEAWKEEERFILRVVINDREKEDDR